MGIRILSETKPVRCDIVHVMNAEKVLADTAILFLALGDKTRLRLLNLMRDREICVSSFTGVLGQSQPLISRHLAYLRNAGVVEARREGKWMHYGISPRLDDNEQRLLFELFKWMEGHEGLRLDREKYEESHSHSEAPKELKPKTMRPVLRKMPPPPAPENEVYVPASHNELEDFLL